MAATGVYKARWSYPCDRCGRVIPSRSLYYRQEPHPMARVHRGEPILRLCPDCAPAWAGWIRAHRVNTEQLQLELDEDTKENRVVVPSRALVKDISPLLMQVLATRPEELLRLSPDQLEALTCERLSAMGLAVSRLGGGVYPKDGGIDIVAVPPRSPMPFLLAVQVKHHRDATTKTDPSAVRELLGVLTPPFFAGMLVTNTMFTPDAKWIEQQHPFLLRLRDVEALRRWVEGNFSDDLRWQGLPNSIEVCPGVPVDISQLANEVSLVVEP